MDLPRQYVVLTTLPLKKWLTSAQLEAAKDGLRRNPEYTPYIQRLVSAGYFKGEREGSQLWTTLENKAAAAFIAARRDEYVTYTVAITASPPTDTFRQ